MKIDPAIALARRAISAPLDHRARHAIVADRSAIASTRAHSFDAAKRLAIPITTPLHQGRPLCSRAPVCLRRPALFDAKLVALTTETARRRGGAMNMRHPVITLAAANLSGLTP